MLELYYKIRDISNMREQTNQYKEKKPKQQQANAFCALPVPSRSKQLGEVSFYRFIIKGAFCAKILSAPSKDAALFLLFFKWGNVRAYFFFLNNFY